MKEEAKKYLAEFIGTFFLVFIGAGVVLVNSINSSAGLVGIAFAHGLALIAIISAFGNVSGAHVNPAVTIAVLVAKKIEAKEALFYIISQMLGASVAALFLMIALPNAPSSAHLGITDLVKDISLSSGIFIEAVLTFFLVLVIFETVVKGKSNPDHAANAIGFVLVFDILMGGTLTGAAMNPARAFGPALVSGYWTNQIVYWAGPIIGGLAAAFVSNLLGEKQ